MSIPYKDALGNTITISSRTSGPDTIPGHDVKALPGTTEADIGTTNTSTAALAATIVGGALKAVLQAGSAAIGKLAANTAATYIGDVILQAGTAAIGKLTANSGVIIGDVNVVSAPSPSSSGPFTQASTSLSTSAAQLSSQAVKHGIWIINTHATNNIFVGPSTVTSSGATVGFPLRPFEVLFQPVANFNQVWLIASAASTSYTVIGD